VISNFVIVQETLIKIRSPEKNKMALHMLSKNYLRDKVFVDAWLERGGLKVIMLLFCFVLFLFCLLFLIFHFSIQGSD
jgi:hypothetical protein